MNENEKNNKVHALPKGIWESSRPVNSKNKEECTPSTDLQGNGYPTENQNKQDK